MSSWQPAKPKVAPERQRKIDAMTAAVAARGFAIATTYNGPRLHPSGGGWAVHIHATPRAIADVNPWEVSAASFEELLETFTDDLAWAQFVHGQLGQPLMREYSDTETLWRRATTRHGDAIAAALRADLEGDAQWVTKHQEQADEAASEARKLHADHLVVRGKWEAYRQTLPLVVDEARAYLAALPLRGGE